MFKLVNEDHDFLNEKVVKPNSAEIFDKKEAKNLKKSIF